MLLEYFRVFVVAITTNVNLDQLRVIATDEDKILAMNDYFGIKNALSAMKMERSSKCGVITYYFLYKF